MQVRAGNLKVQYHEGSLRYFTIDGHEFLRRIYVAIRDENWNTAPIEIHDERIEPTEDTFEIHYRWTTETPRMQGEVTLTGDADGTIAYTWTGEALEDFKKNRVGLCVLHPIDELRGKPVRIIHPNGEETAAEFPDQILPHQPFMTIAAMEWNAGSALKAHLELEGDIFETEDQRNFSDTSYKTYATPQSLPKPVWVEKGTTFEQKATVSFEGEWPPVVATELPLRVDLAGNPKPFPAWGLQWPTESRALTDEELTLLRRLSPSHILLSISLLEDNWQQHFQQSFDCIQKLNIPVVLSVTGSQDTIPDLDFFSGKSLIKEVVILDENGLTTDALLQTALPTLRNRWPSLRIGGGTKEFFVEFNQNPFDYPSVDFVTFALSPQVHCTDDLSIMENLAAQYDMVHTAKTLSSKPVHVQPVTLHPSNEPDERHNTEFSSSWTVGSLKYLSEAGAESITYVDVYGKTGLLNGNQTGPLYDFFAFLSEFKPERVIPSRSSKPLQCSSIILEKGDKWKTTVIANHTDRKLDVRLPEDVRITLAPYEWKAVF